MTAGSATPTVVLPLTPSQFGMLYESVLSDRPWASIEQAVCTFDDERLDLDLLDRAWRRVQERHETLRSSIRWTALEGDDPTMIVHPDAPLRVAHLDWTHLDPADQGPAYERWLEADRVRGVDVEVPPAMRIQVISLAERRWKLVWTYHHALIDGRSMQVVVSRLLEAYRSLLAGDDDILPYPVPPQFREHVARLIELDEDAAAEHFRTRLAGAEPTPAPGASDRSDSGRTLEVVTEVTDAVTARLRALASRHDVTLGSVVLAAWGVLVARYTGHHDVVFGAARSARHLVSNSDYTVGCLMNTVPVRVTLPVGISVPEMLRAVRGDQVAVRPFEHAPLGVSGAALRVSGAARPVHSLVVFDRHRENDPSLMRRGTWEGGTIELHEHTSMPVVLDVYHDEVTDVLQIRLEYDTGVYHRARALEVLDHFVTLLGALAESPDDATVDSLEMLAPAERTHLVDELNPEPPTGPASPFLPRFDRQVASTPDAVALRDLATGEEVTYADLDRASRRVAGRLRSHLTDAQVVGVCLSRSPSFVIAMLGILRAGGAFVTLDPAQPGAALERVVAGADVRVVIGSTVTRHAVPASVTCVLDVDETDGPTVEADHPVAEHVDPERPAYVVFTSGTTGTPNGVVVSHAALGAYLDAIIERFSLTGADRTLQFASLSFDVALEEILPSLAVGATLVLRSEEVAGSIPTFLEMVRTEGLTLLNLPTAFWHVLVDHLDDGLDLPGVRLVVVGGEKVSRAAFVKWLDIVPQIPIANAYGPTETTITCTVFDAPDRLPPTGELPIGTPLANSRAYVLGGDGRWLVPKGQVGELWIGGRSVASGYHGRAELTAQRFRPDPFSDEPGARMYRTGDRARWLPGGDIEYLGRADRQLKVRGVRIEPQAIETTLEEHPDVVRGYVDVRTGPAGDTRLVAWVISAVGGLDRESVDRWLRAELPSTMVPASIVEVTEIPRTPNGKVDLAALPAPEPTAADRDEMEAVRDPDLALLCSMFRDLLPGDVAIGPDDSFFDHGGHSLLAVRLLGRIERSFGVRTSITVLHLAQTPLALLGALRDRDGSEDDGYLVPIQPDGSRPPIYGVHVLGPNESYYRPLAERLGPDQPVLGLSVGLPGADAPSTVVELARCYAEEIHRHQPKGPLALVAVSLGSFVAVELAQQLRDAGREVLLVGLFDALGPASETSPTEAPRGWRGQIQRIRHHGRELRRGGWTYVQARRAGRALRRAEQAEFAEIRERRDRGEPIPAHLTRSALVLANVEAADTYVARPYEGRMLVFFAVDEFHGVGPVDDLMGWEDVAVGPFAITDVRGGHLSMLDEPHVRTVAARLGEAIDEAVAADE